MELNGTVNSMENRSFATKTFLNFTFNKHFFHIKILQFSFISSEKKKKKNAKTGVCSNR